jgi:pSer/pThr/pTyr-binding forkhead associated (FHA) protein
MILRHLRAILDKGHNDLDKKHSSMAFLDFHNGGVFPVHDVATIGRAPDSHIAVNERSVSRHHARVFYESGHYWLKDLDSANGTTVNGKKIRLQMLSSNDKIVFGDAKAVFRASGQPGPAAIGNDPLEGSDRQPLDGTPTDGLGSTDAATNATTADDRSPQELENDLEYARKQLANKKKEMESLEMAIEGLRRENAMLVGRLEQLQNAAAESPITPIPASSEVLMQENDRLKKLIKQLEKTLADVNLRFRNLQELYDRKSN